MPGNLHFRRKRAVSLPKLILDASNQVKSLGPRSDDDDPQNRSRDGDNSNSNRSGGSHSGSDGSNSSGSIGNSGGSNGSSGSNRSGNSGSNDSGGSGGSGGSSNSGSGGGSNSGSGSGGSNNNGSGSSGRSGGGSQNNSSGSGGSNRESRPFDQCEGGDDSCRTTTSRSSTSVSETSGNPRQTGSDQNGSINVPTADIPSASSGPFTVTVTARVSQTEAPSSSATSDVNFATIGSSTTGALFPTTLPPADDSGVASAGRSNAGVIAGSVAGAVMFMSILGVFAYFKLRNKRYARKPQADNISSSFGLTSYFGSHPSFLQSPSRAMTVHSSRHTLTSEKRTGIPPFTPGIFEEKPDDSNSLYALNRSYMP